VARRAIATAQQVLLCGALCLLFNSGTHAAVESASALALLKKADNIKSSSQTEFGHLMTQIDSMANTMSSEERLYARYLKGWQVAYTGNYSAAIPILESTVAETQEATLRFRARATMINVLSIAKNYEKAFSELNYLLDAMPAISDHDAREQGLRVAALLYSQVGQHDVAVSYAEKLNVKTGNWRDACTAQELNLRVTALQDLHKLQKAGPEFQAGIEFCRKVGELVFANLINTYVARINFALNDFDDVIKRLTERYNEVVLTKYPPLISEVESLLAQAYRETGNVELAKRFALRAAASAVQNDYRESSVNAFRLLYLISKEQGDTRSALMYHEKYMVADKGYLDDITARQLAYQRIRQEVEAGKLQIDALNKQNEVLQLQRALSEKAVENIRLYIALLAVILISIALWAYKTKRSQMHFMKLSRRDGLTGIYNRPHFIELSEATLKNARKNRQDVCVVLCDLDHFKAVNDNYGHAEGDYVLQRAVTACQMYLRASDVFARIGGEEFGVLLPGCTMEEARTRVERLRVAVTESNPSDGKFKVSASFGISSTNSSGYELQTLMTHADAALYQAKRSGRNCVVAYDAKDPAITGPRVVYVEGVRAS
jgi:diguanylate cyclase (GGDEF)-like protein